MPGDYSRKTFNRKKHYSGVLMQQGRVQLDADWNEQLEIHQYRTLTETKDVIGTCGVPKQNDGFKIGVLAGGSDLSISPGRIYAGGLLCELEPAGTGSTYLNQPYYPNPDKSFFSTFQSPPQSPPGSPPDGTPVNLQNGTYLVYLDAWQQEINFRDDSLIHEVALGEADTTTRLKNVWQIKLLKLTSAAITCKTPVITEWQNLIAPRSGTLNVRANITDEGKNPCLLPPRSGFRRLENQLYRVEVQKADATAKTFKWSRDNATVETTITAIDDVTVTVSDIGKDDVLGFAGGQWIEIVDEESSLNGKPNPLIQIDSVNPATRQIKLKSSANAYKEKVNRKLRRWDQSGPTARADGVPTTGAWIDLEDGLQVKFSAGTYRPGDFWLIPARTATREVEWPPFEIPNVNPIPQLPAGIQHQYCRLALVKVLNRRATLEDCRERFPSLTDICAEDVCFDNSACSNSKAETVQEALEELCHNRENSCTFVAVPGPAWESVFDLIGDGKDAQICFQVGTYLLRSPAMINNKGNLKLSGCGAGTRIVAASAEAGLVFSNCKTILVRDLYAETGIAGAKKGSPTEHLNGTLTFINCTTIIIGDVHLKCGSGVTRAATCISFRNEVKSPGSVCIQNCNLEVGHQQGGILLVNVSGALVENNTIRVYEKPASIKLPDLLKTKQGLAGIRKLLISNAQIGVLAPVGENTNITLTAGGQSIHFKTLNSLKKAWKDVFAANPPANVTPKNLMDHVYNLSDRIITDEAFRKPFAQFNALLPSLIQQDRAVASQGITIGGRIAKNIRILNNTIHGILQGIHVGLSTGVGQDIPDLTEAMIISGNNISILLTPDIGKLDRYGLFVGNCKSLVIENNNIQLERLKETDNFLIDGIRIWGLLGNRVMVTKNYLFSSDGNPQRSFNIGINLNPISPKPAMAQWVVMWNVAPSKQSTVRVINGAIALQGTNTP